MSETEPEKTEADVPAPETAQTADELSKLREAASKADEYLDLARRTKADFLNYQARVRRDEETKTRFASEEFARSLLPALDAVVSCRTAADGGGDLGSLAEGVRLIEREFRRLFELRGITPIDAEGKTFDPALHEVLAVVEQEGAAANQVVEVVRGGWMIHDRVLRPALVKIAKAAD